MTNHFDAQLASDALNALENRELPLLHWGVTDGSLTEGEALQALRVCLDESDHPTSLGERDLLAEMEDRGLVFRIPGSSDPRRYRTRFAETIRLTAHLRQLFAPRDLDNPPSDWWQQGRRLVSDYRLHVAARRFPRRDQTSETVLAALRGLDGWTDLHTEVAARQIGDRDLARFQVEATTSIFASLHGQSNRGTLVGAGTGSGKTMAFYLPAFAAMTERAMPGRYGVQALALYPRKELLRDQLQEAIRTAQRINKVLVARGQRPLRIGALYGDTPKSATDPALNAGGRLRKAWRADRGDNLICPYFSCPQCDADLIWHQRDRSSRRRGEQEILRCRTGHLTLGAEDIVLTRESLCSQPPDLLFTTTEMLNNKASDPDLGWLLGWTEAPTSRRPKRNIPRLVLLDEVHTYSGVHGAQVALLLRRWRHAIRTPVTLVGLSATLRDGADFFAQLVGVDRDSVDYIKPQDEDLDDVDREYVIALRGNPVAATNLLSTTIQTSMLYGRVLDPPGKQFLYGTKGFLFTDDLDVTNRLFDDLRDAEGWRRGRRAAGHVLAGLRSPDAPWRTTRYADGQSWDIVHRVDRQLAKKADGGALNISRTSSQDAGVDPNADLVVTTGSLEVGYDDPAVGLVLQHKAPRDAASFIQRRGRAGRSRERHTRPITVVVLSDYGRDRLAYQTYDSLFVPEIPVRSLPVGNRHVLKIQGAQALLDWLSLNLSGGADPRKLLQAPYPSQKYSEDKARSLAELLERLLDQPALQAQLKEHLRRALAISADEADALLWEQPRALLLTVAPTALRRLLCGWQPVERDPGAEPGDLLPEFLTRALFEPLNIPAVQFTLPTNFGHTDDEGLPIEHALREAVPGRVSRRFGYHRDDHRTWVALPTPTAGGALEVASFVVAGVREGEWALPQQGGTVEVVRPQRIQLTEPPRDVHTSAQGIPEWATDIVTPPQLHALDVPDPSPWAGRILSSTYATHAGGNPAEVRRMTTGALCETRYQGTRPATTTTVRYTFEGRPAALGFRLTVDAMTFTLAPLDMASETVIEYLASPSWRALAFTTSVAEDSTLDGVLNAFQRQWLTQVYLTAFSLAGADGSRSPQQIHAAMRAGAWRHDLAAIIGVLYREPAPAVQSNARSLINTLDQVSRNQQVVDCLDRHGQLLWAADIATRTADLARRSYRDTVAAAILAAAQRACPDAHDNDLIVDIQPGATAEHAATIWISETAIGGLGLIEQLMRFYSQDPRGFWNLVGAMLGPSEYEQIDASITHLLSHVDAHPASQAATAMDKLRAPTSTHDTQTALDELRAAWTEIDGPPTHAAVTSLVTRLLRPGSTAATPRHALRVITAWDALQNRLGVEIDASAIAYLVGDGHISLGESANALTADQVFSMLWLRGRHARAQNLQHYQPYEKTTVLDRLLAGAAHTERLPTVDITATDWQDRYRVQLTQHGAIELVAPAGDQAALADAVRHVPLLPIDQGLLRVYGRVTGLQRRNGQRRVLVDIREMVQ
jgi:ATP-dependent helicase Lhr and Lhr-like helicase